MLMVSYPPTDGLPTLTPGRDLLPTRCAHCGSGTLLAEPPFGPHARGMLWCQVCSRSACWLRAPLPERRQRSAAPAAAPSAPLAASMPTHSSLGGVAWRRLTCGPTCRRERVVLVGRQVGPVGAAWREYHDPDVHDQYHQVLTTGLAVLLASPVRAEVEVVSTGPLTVDLRTQRVWVQHRERYLTATEWGLLARLATRLDRICDRDALVAALWPSSESRRHRGARLAGADPYQPLRVHMQRLRPKLTPAGQLIETVPGIGYRLRFEEATS
jgi:DNA-binding winged helix-turn-helix (wHTH) protein